MLIQATTRSIAKFGYSGTTIERICAEAGVSRGLINHHFGSKERLVLHAYRQLCEEWVRYTQGSVDANADPAEVLRDAIEKNFDTAVVKTESLGVWLGFWSVIPKSSELQKLDRALYKADLLHFQTLFERVASKRRIKLDARLQAIGLLALIEGLWLQRTLDAKSLSMDEARAACLATVAHLLD